MFEGVFCPSITITDDEGKIDFDLWGKHLDHLTQASTACFCSEASASSTA